MWFQSSQCARNTWGSQMASHQSDVDHFGADPPSVASLQPRRSVALLLNFPLATRSSVWSLHPPPGPWALGECREELLACLSALLLQRDVSFQASWLRLATFSWLGPSAASGPFSPAGKQQGLCPVLLWPPGWGGPSPGPGGPPSISLATGRWGASAGVSRGWPHHSITALSALTALRGLASSSYQITCIKT